MPVSCVLFRAGRTKKKRQMQILSDGAKCNGLGNKKNKKCTKERPRKRKRVTLKSAPFFLSLGPVLFKIAFFFFITPALNRTGLYSTGPAQTRFPGSTACKREDGEKARRRRRRRNK